MKRSIRWAIPVLMALASCVSSSDAQAEADVYIIVAPAHRDYLEHDVTLSTDARMRRLELLDAWRKRIAAKGGKVR